MNLLEMGDGGYLYPTSLFKETRVYETLDKHFFFVWVSYLYNQLYLKILDRICEYLGGIVIYH